MKKVGLVFALLIFALSLSAQLRTGEIQGKVVSKEGLPLSGVKVTLSRPLAADQKAVTGRSGIFRFPGVSPASDYGVKAELPDFKTAARSGVVVALGGRVSVDLVLEPGKPEELVSVTTPSPAIDRTRFTSGASFGWTELQTLPTARDPWVIVQLVPGVMLDRENVGGNESSEQSHFVARGDSTNGIDNTWIVDGIDVSDSIELGLSDINYDFDAIDTLSVTTGGAADVTQQTAGIAVNLLTRRGGNKIAGTARFFLTDHAFQSDNLTTALRSKGVPNTNKIQQIRDFGASVGGPLVKDRIWAWLAYGVQDLFAYTIYDFQDRTLFNNYNFKLNIAPFAGNRVEALFTTSQKERFGVNADPSKPEGDHQTGRFRLGSPIFKFQDEQVIGNSLYLSAKFTWTNTGTTVKPMVDEALTTPVTFDVGEGVYVPFSTLYGRSWDYSRSIRANKNVQFAATLFRDDFLGMSHEIKAGLEFADKKVTSVSGFAQNYEVFRNFTDPLIDLGEGLVVPPSDWQRVVMNRDNRQIALASQSSGYLQDTITKGRFALQLGLRYDYQKPSLGATGISTTLSILVERLHAGCRDLPGHVFASSHRQRRQRQIPVEHLVPQGRVQLGPQGGRPDRAQARSGPVWRRSRRRRQRSPASGPHREHGLLVERHGRRFAGRSHGDLLEVFGSPRHDPEPALRPFYLGRGLDRSGGGSARRRVRKRRLPRR